MPGPIPLPKIRGRNGWDDMLTGPDDLAVEVENIDLYEGGIGTKRGGLTHTFTSTTGLGGNQWNDATIGADYAVLYRTQPGQVATGSVLLIFGAASKVYSIYNAGAGSTVASTTLTLAPESDTARAKTSAATINAKVIVGMDTSENRVQVLEGLGSASPTCRRAGLKVPAAATVTDTGAGAYAAVLRYYRIQWRRIASGLVKNRSPLGASVSFTPSGAGTAARITRPAPNSEGATHWVVYGSDDDLDYYEVSDEILMVTTTYDDDDAPGLYNAGDAAPLEGSNIPFPSCRYLLAAFNRLFGFGRYETSAGDSLSTNDGIVYHSPARGETDDDTEEVINNTEEEAGFLPLDENAAGIDRALCGPLNNVIYAFKDRGIYGIIPTDAVAAPFKSVSYSPNFGAVSNESTLIAEDELGNPSMYFIDPRDGWRRIGQNGLEWIGKDNADLWPDFNNGATVKSAHGVYVHPRKQIWWWIATDDEERPDHLFIYDVTNGQRDRDGALRGGWQRWSGFIAGESPASGVLSAVMFPRDLEDLTSQDIPYVIVNGSLNATTEANGLCADKLYHMDFESAGAETISNGAAYTAELTTKAYGGDGFKTKVGRVLVAADAAAGVTVHADIIGNTGEGVGVTQTGFADLTPLGDEAHVVRPMEDLDLAQLWAWQLKLKDKVDTDQRWTIHRVLVAPAAQDKM